MTRTRSEQRAQLLNNNREPLLNSSCTVPVSLSSDVCFSEEELRGEIHHRRRAGVTQGQRLRIKSHDLIFADAINLHSIPSLLLIQCSLLQSTLIIQQTIKRYAYLIRIAHLSQLLVPPAHRETLWRQPCDA